MEREERILAYVGDRSVPSRELLGFMEEELGLRPFEARMLLADMVRRGLLERVPDYGGARMVFRRPGRGPG